MRALHALLSPHEENVLRRVGFEAADGVQMAHLKRLLQLGLVEWGGWTWRLTATGRRRYAGLVFQASPGAFQPPA